MGTPLRFPPQKVLIFFKTPICNEYPHTSQSDPDPPILNLVSCRQLPDYHRLNSTITLTITIGEKLSLAMHGILTT